MEPISGVQNVKISPSMFRTLHIVPTVSVPNIDYAFNSRTANISTRPIQILTQLIQYTATLSSGHMYLTELHCIFLWNP